MSIVSVVGAEISGADAGCVASSEKERGASEGGLLVFRGTSQIPILKKVGRIYPAPADCWFPGSPRSLFSTNRKTPAEVFMVRISTPYSSV